MTTKRKNGVQLPGYIPEPSCPEGDGPMWIAAAIGAAPGTPIAATAYRSAEDDATAIVLQIAELEITYRPARLIVTRRLTETLGARGFPIPYYEPPQLAKLGQAIARLAHQAEGQEEERAADELASLLAGWARDCLRENVSYILRGREGKDVRAAIEHVRNGYVKGSSTVPLILEPGRKPAPTLLAWTVPVRTVIRERLGTMHDGDIGLQLQRGGLVRTRLAARPTEGSGTVELPTWVLPNGWQGVQVKIPDTNGESGTCTLPPVVERSATDTRTPGQAHGGD